MSKIYAQLDSNNICEAITEYMTPLDSPPSDYKEIDTNEAEINEIYGCLIIRWNAK